MTTERDDLYGWTGAQARRPKPSATPVPTAAPVATQPAGQVSRRPEAAPPPEVPNPHFEAQDAFQSAGGDFASVKGGFASRPEDPQAVALSRLPKSQRIRLLVDAGYAPDSAGELAGEIDSIFPRGNPLLQAPGAPGQQAPAMPAEFTGRKAVQGLSLLATGGLLDVSQVGAGKNPLGWLGASSIVPGGFAIGMGAPYAADVTLGRGNQERGEAFPTWARTSLTLGFGLAAGAAFSKLPVGGYPSLARTAAEGPGLKAGLFTPLEVQTGEAAARIAAQARRVQAAAKRELGRSDFQVPFEQRPQVAGAALNPAQPATGVMPTHLQASVFGLRPIRYGLTQGQQAANTAYDWLAKVSGNTIAQVRNHPVSQAILRERERALAALDSDATQFAQSFGQRIRASFKFDRQGHISDLAGIDPRFPSGPTVADLGAKYQTFVPHLSVEQQAALTDLRDTIETYSAAWKQARPGVGTRADIEPGGFYVPRGRAAEDGFLETKVYASPAPRGAGTPGAAKAATFASQEDGILKGYQYDSLETALQKLVTGAGREVVDDYASRAFLSATDNLGQPLAQPLTGAARDTGSIGRIGGLAGYAFPDELTNAANKVLKREGPSEGLHSALTASGTALNNFLRGVRATGDLSAAGIQMLLGVADSPKAYEEAFSAMTRSLFDRNAFGAMLNDFNARALSQGRLSTKLWAQSDLRIGGIENEFTLGQRSIPFGERIQNIPGIKESTRAYGVGTDSLRLQWADDLLWQEMQRSGKTAQQLMRDGTTQKIAAIVNKATGYSLHRAGADVGDLVFFAPRFFQSQIDFLTRGLQGTAKGNLFARTGGGTLEQQVAARTLTRYIAGAATITYLANRMQGKQTDWRPLVNGRYNTDFMAIDYGGRKWQLLGPVNRVPAMLVNTSAALAGKGPGNRWAAARTILSAPLPSTLWDFFANEDFYGRRTRSSPGAVASFALRSLTPFASGNLPDTVKRAATGQGLPTEQGASRASALLNLTGDMLGFRGTPLSMTNELDRLVRERNLDKEGNPAPDGQGVERWDDLESWVRGTLYDNDPQVKAVYQQHEREADPNIERRLRDAAIANQHISDQALERGALEPSQWKDMLHDEAVAAAARHQALVASGASQERRDTSPEGKALDGYYAIADALEKPGLPFDSDRYWSEVAAYMTGLTPELRDYVLRSLHPHGTPLVKRYYAFLQEQRDLDWRHLYRRYPEVLVGIPPQLLPLYEQYQAAPDPKAWLDQQPPALQPGLRALMALMAQRLGIVQDAYRSTHPEFDANWSLFNGGAAFTPEGQRREAVRLRAKGQSDLRALHSGGSAISGEDVALLAASGFRSLEDVARANPSSLPRNGAKWRWQEQAKAILEGK